MGPRTSEIRNHANLIWGIAELLRGDYKQSDYGEGDPAAVVMRRLDQVLEPTRDQVHRPGGQARGRGRREPRSWRCASSAGQQFFNRHRLRFHQLLDDPGQHRRRTCAPTSTATPRSRARSSRSSTSTRRSTGSQDANLLYKVIARVCDVDLHPDRVSNARHGRDLRGADPPLRRGIQRDRRRALHPARGRAADGQPAARRRRGRAARAGRRSAPSSTAPAAPAACCPRPRSHIHRFNNERRRPPLRPGAQPASPTRSAWPTCSSRARTPRTSCYGNSLSDDGHAGERFHYCIANPPFGVDWTQGRGRDPRRARDARLRRTLRRRACRASPTASCCSCMHLISKMRDPEDGGTRIAIVHNGSPLFTGAAGSGESKIRRWIIENDWLEAIVALPEQLFYNTGIASYVWVVTNRKSPEREGKVQLIDARETVGEDAQEPGREAPADQRRADRRDHPPARRVRRRATCVKIIPNEAFGYRTITVDRPLRARWEIGARHVGRRRADDKAIAKLDATDARCTIVGDTARVPARTLRDRGGLRATRSARRSPARLPKPPAPLAQGTRRALPRPRSER